jgi:V/A-type H+-transporting ATPase subunit E
MEGIEKITQRLAADAQAEADAILADAKAQADSIAADWNAQAQKEHDDIVSRGGRNADERAKRMESVAQMEGRKLILAAKQEMIGKAFDRALEKLLALPEEEYVDLLAGLCAKAAVTGREEVIFSQKDRAKVGKAVVAKANELLAKQVAPQLPTELTGSPAGAILDKVVTAGSALLAGTGALTLSQETRNMEGGFILSADGVEVNCAFDTLVRLARPQLELQVARILFED